MAGNGDRACTAINEEQKLYMAVSTMTLVAKTLFSFFKGGIGRLDMNYCPEIVKAGSDSLVNEILHLAI